MNRNKKDTIQKRKIKADKEKINALVNFIAGDGTNPNNFLQYTGTTTVIRQWNEFTYAANDIVIPKMFYANRPFSEMVSLMNDTNYLSILDKYICDAFESFKNNQLEQVNNAINYYRKYNGKSYYGTANIASEFLVRNYMLLAKENIKSNTPLFRNDDRLQARDGQFKLLNSDIIKMR